MAIKISGTTVINDDRNIENVGVITASTFVGDGSGLTGVGVGAADNINTSGIITASTFVGDGSGLTGVGVGAADNINTSGIITASTISANEFIGTGDKLIFSPSATSFSPTDGSTDQSANTNISITFDQPVYAGVGSIFLRNSSGIGTEIASIGIASTSVSFSNQTVTIDPPTELPVGTDVYVVLPSQSIENAVGGFIATISNYNFSTSAFEFSSIVPANGATSVAPASNITITFSDVPVRGTGTVELRYTSAAGTVIESFDAASAGEITISGNDWILNPSVSFFTDPVFLVVPSTAIDNFAGINVAGGEFAVDGYSFTPTAPALGDAYEGGFLICQTGGTRWIVAPQTAQVSVNWHDRGQANTCAGTISGCSGWFVPTAPQLVNPGFNCSTYWDAVTAGTYWSNTQIDGRYARHVNTGGGCSNPTKTVVIATRSFRNVSY